MAGTGGRANDSRRLLLLLLVVACALRVYAETTYADLGQDKTRQLLIAESYARGHGFSLCTADPSDLSRPRHQPFNQWPIGYPLLIAGLTPIAGDPIAAAHVLDALGVAVLVCSLYSLLGMAGASVRGRAWFLVFTALSFAPYYDLGSTDLLAVSCFVLASALTLRQLGAPRPSVVAGVLAGIVLSAAAFLRYAYHPLSAVVPGCAVLAGWWIRDRALLRTGIVAGVTFAALLGAVIALHIHHFGVATRAVGDGGVWASNLLHIAPFPLQAVLYTDVLIDNLHVVVPALDGAVRAAAIAVSALILVAVLRPCGGLVRDALQRRRPGPRPAPFWLLVGVTILANTGLMCWVSLASAPQTGWTEFYTHVQESRFWAPSMFLIQISLVLLLLRDGPPADTWQRAGRVGLAAIMLFTAAYAGYRAFKVHALGEPTVYADKRDTVARVIETIEESRGGGLDGIVYADADNVIRAGTVAVLTDALPVLDCAELVDGGAPTSRSVDLFLLGSAAPSASERAFLGRTGAEPVDEIGASTLYRVRLRP